MSVSEHWDCGNGGLLSLFLPESPPPIFGVDACKMSLLLVYFICDVSFFISVLCAAGSAYDMFDLCIGGFVGRLHLSHTSITSI